MMTILIQQKMISFISMLMIMIMTIATGVVSAEQTSRLQIHIPSTLNTGTKEGYDHRDALFGIPPYGGSIQETVYYTTDTLCSSSSGNNNNNNRPHTYPDTKGKSMQSPFILMVDRGDCTFVQKVRNAQRIGAAAVLIADNTCQCTAVECKLEEGEECEGTEPIMADDGSGSDVTIASFLVFKQDADKIKDYLKKNKPVRAEMSFALPTETSRVQYDLWTTPKDSVSRDFLKSFKEAAIALGSSAYFTPRNYIYDGLTAGCQSGQGKNECFSLCTNEGRYCASDPENDLTIGVSGADVVTESLRRMCIWNIYGSTDGIGLQWWDYVTEFLYRCDDPDKPGYFTNDQCIKDAMTHSNISYTDVTKCMDDSGGLVENVQNTLFDDQLAQKETAGAFLIPSLFVNQAPIRGEMSYSTVFRAICAGYSSGHQPKICIQCADCNDEISCIEQHGKCTAGTLLYGAMLDNGGVPFSIFGTSILLLSCCFGIIGYCQYKSQQRYMNEQIRGIVQEYMPVGS
jgi:PA domain